MRQVTLSLNQLLGPITRLSWYLLYKGILGAIYKIKMVNCDQFFDRKSAGLGP